MAYPTDLFKKITLVGADIGAPLQAPISLMNSVYRDLKTTEFGSSGQSVDIVFPGALTAANDASTVQAYQDVTTSVKTVTLTLMPAVNVRIKHWDKVRTDADIENMILLPARQAIRAYVNGQIASLITANNFDSYTPIASATAKTLTLGQLRDARANLRNAGVPVDEVGKMAVVCHGTVYENTLFSDNFTRADIVGPARAEDLRASGQIMPSFATRFFADGQMPIDTTPTPDEYLSIFMHEWAIGVAYRPSEIPSTVKGSYVDIDGIPVRVLMSYDPANKCDQLSFDFAYGQAVIRKECGHLIRSAIS